MEIKEVATTCVFNRFMPQFQDHINLFFIENHAFVTIFDVSNAFAQQKNSTDAKGFL